MNLKPPVWTWEIPAYFFIGGVAGVAAAMAGVYSIAGDDAALVRDARWVAAAGAVVSPMLLVSDLGRPERFLNMLRVFKHRSPMSIGVWGLVAFSAAVFSSIVVEWSRGPSDSSVVTALAGALDALCIVLGLLLATYTGVLIGVTSVPVWARHVRLLPMHFGASSLGAGVAVLELMGHRTPALNLIAMAAAIVETGIGVRLEMRRELSSSALGKGAASLLTRLGDLGSGPVSLLLRLGAPAWGPARQLAAVAAIAGSVFTRYGWLAAGRQSTGVRS
jgi:formate-dependent nitrite reductase membrane component NrfD